MTTQQILIHFVKTDPGTQAREKLDFETVAEYAAAIEANDKAWPFPPVIIFFDGHKHWLADGFHRVAAARRVLLDSVPADVREGSRRDAILYAAGANADHGLKRTPADKNKAVLTLLNDEEWGQWSDREIARLCKVSHTFVANVRREVTGNVASDNQERVYTNKQGDTAVMKTGNIGARPSELILDRALAAADELRGMGYQVDIEPASEETPHIRWSLNGGKLMYASELCTFCENHRIKPVRNGEQTGTAVPEPPATDPGRAEIHKALLRSLDRPRTSPEKWETAAANLSPADAHLLEAITPVYEALLKLDGGQRYKIADYLRNMMNDEPKAIAAFFEATARFVRAYKTERDTAG